jgi:hypothetical protein
MSWDIELENGALPSDSASFAWETTVVIDTGRNWGDQGGAQRSLQLAMDFCGEPRSIATGSLDKRSPSSLRVASRFFPKHVSSLSFREDAPTPRMPTAEWEGHSNGEPEVSISALDNLVDCHCLDVGWGHGPGWETNSFSGDGYRAHLFGTLHMVL